MRPRPIPKSTFRLMGGLGNQLFIYAAGLSYARAVAKQLELELDEGLPSIRNHGSSLAQFDEPKVLVTRKSSSRLASLSPRQISSTYKSNVVGYDPKLLSQTSKTRFQGYFQTYVYLDDIQRKEGFSLSLTDISQNLKSFLEEVDFADSVCLHVRRGDYLKSKNKDIGVLSVKYFQNALAKLDLSARDLGEKLFIFSDSISQVRSEFITAFPDATYVGQHSFTASESLVLMSRFQRFVGSNSSFSWWAAALGDSQAVFPGTWFRFMPPPEKLLFPKWQKSEAIWLS